MRDGTINEDLFSSSILRSIFSRPKAKKFGKYTIPNFGIYTVPRKDMPQIKPIFIEEFKEYLKKNGVGTFKKRVRLDSLKPTQGEFNPKKIESAMKYASQNRDYLVMVSRDSFIIDGHHRWAAEYNRDNDGMVDVLIVDARIKKALKLAREFPKSTRKTLTMENAPSGCDACVAYLEGFRDYYSTVEGELDIDVDKESVALSGKQFVRNGAKRDIPALRITIFPAFRQSGAGGGHTYQVYVQSGHCCRLIYMDGLNASSYRMVDKTIDELSSLSSIYSRAEKALISAFGSKIFSFALNEGDSEMRLLGTVEGEFALMSMHGEAIQVRYYLYEDGHDTPATVIDLTEENFDDVMPGIIEVVRRMIVA